ncbi:MAG: penicillin-binding protein activator LpoB [Planctomycetes bacterium]|nr:penicillin-binding protein activator LpoB [Planctomycetota bacterium]
MRAGLNLMAMGVAGAATVLAGCQSTGIIRVDPEMVTDVNPRFNDTDARQFAQELSDDILSRPWIDNWMRENGGKRPIVFLGNIRNDTEEYIETDLFTNQIQRTMINSGRVRVKAEREARAELRDERLDTKYNDPATIKAVARELNADFALVGKVIQVRQESANRRHWVNFYQANMELINVETAEVVWSGIKEIKKVGG